MERKQSFQKIIQETDISTGEVITITKHFTKTVDVNKFVKLFEDNIGVLLNFKSVIDFKILLLLLKKMEYETNIIIFDSDTKKELCEILEISIKTLYNSTIRLMELNLIYKLNRTKFKVNEDIFYKGKAKKYTNTDNHKELSKFRKENE